MKKLVWLAFFLTACSPQEEIKEEVVAENPEQETWIVYEGVVKSEEGNDIKMQLSLLQNSVGLESQYKSEEEYISTEDERLLTNRQGKYSILYGTGTDMTITLDGSVGGSLGWQSGKGYSIDPKKVTDKLSEEAKVGKLYFKTGVNSDELVLVDNNSNPIAEDDRYTLKKRSILFTVEGFVTVSNNGTEFFEMHTRENWNVSQSGAFNEVEKKYFNLATEKFEGIYLKGVAYYINGIDSTGTEVSNLVIKRIIAMKGHQEYVSSGIRN